MTDIKGKTTEAIEKDTTSFVVKAGKITGYAGEETTTATKKKIVEAAEKAMAPAVADKQVAALKKELDDMKKSHAKELKTLKDREAKLKKELAAALPYAIKGKVLTAAEKEMQEKVKKAQKEVNDAAKAALTSLDKALADMVKLSKVDSRAVKMERIVRATVTDIATRVSYLIEK